MTPHFEKRCLWVVRYTLTSKTSIDKLINFASQHNFNHIFVQVRGRGDSFYKSSWIPKSELLNLDEFDPLDYIIKQAQAHKIKVHAWVNVYMIWSAEQKPKNNNHIFNRNPDWIDAVENESLKYSFTHQRYPDDVSGKEGFYLAPHHPNVNPHMLAVFKELINKYKIDGIHLDYIRYKNESHGYNPEGLNQFKKDCILSENYNFESSEAFFDKLINKKQMVQWQDFLLNSVTELVIKLKSYINNNIERKIILSAAVKPNINKANQNFHQEWDIWLEGGIVDWVLVMNYNPDLIAFANNISIIEETITEKKIENIIMGIALYNQSPEDVIKKINYSYNAGFSGISLFSYNVLDENFHKMQMILSLVNE